MCIYYIMVTTQKTEYKVIGNNSKKIGIYKCNKPKEAFYKALNKVNYDRSIVKMNVIQSNTKKVYGPYYTKSYIDNFEQNGGLYTKMPTIYKILVEVLKENNIGKGLSDEKIKDNFLKEKYNSQIEGEFKNIYRDFHIKLDNEYNCIQYYIEKLNKNKNKNKLVILKSFDNIYEFHNLYNTIFLECLKDKSTKSTLGLTRQSNERYLLIINILNKFLKQTNMIQNISFSKINNERLIDYIYKNINEENYKDFFLEELSKNHLDRKYLEKLYSILLVLDYKNINEVINIYFNKLKQDNINNTNKYNDFNKYFNIIKKNNIFDFGFNNIMYDSLNNFFKSCFYNININSKLIIDFLNLIINPENYNIAFINFWVYSKFHPLKDTITPKDIDKTFNELTENDLLMNELFHIYKKDNMTECKNGKNGKYFIPNEGNRTFNFGDIEFIYLIYWYYIKNINEDKIDNFFQDKISKNIIYKNSCKEKENKENKKKYRLIFTEYTYKLLENNTINNKVLYFLNYKNYKEINKTNYITYFSFLTFINYLLVKYINEENKDKIDYYLSIKNNSTNLNISSIEKNFLLLDQKNNYELKDKVDEIFSYLNYYLNEILIKDFYQETLIIFFNAYYTLFNLVHLYFPEKINRLNDFEELIGIRIKEKKQFEYEKIFNTLPIDEKQPFNIKYLNLFYIIENLDKVQEFINNYLNNFKIYNSLNYLYKLIKIYKNKNKEVSNYILSKLSRNQLSRNQLNGNQLENEKNKIIKNFDNLLEIIEEKQKKIKNYIFNYGIHTNDFLLIKENLKFFIIFNKDFGKNRILDITELLKRINQNLEKSNNYLNYFDILNLIDIYNNYFSYSNQVYKSILESILIKLNENKQPIIQNIINRLNNQSIQLSIEENRFIQNNYHNEKTFSLYFVRHAFSCANMYKELNNKITQTLIKDPHLTDYGILSAKLIGEQFFEKKIKINKFYVSPLIRTWETAYSFLKKDIGFPTDLKLTIAPYTKEKGSTYDNQYYNFEENIERFKQYKLAYNKLNNEYNSNEEIKYETINLFNTPFKSNLYISEHKKEGNIKDFIEFLKYEKDVKDDSNIMLFGHSNVLQKLLMTIDNKIYNNTEGSRNFMKYKKYKKSYNPFKTRINKPTNYKENVLNNNVYIWKIDVKYGKIVDIELVNHGFPKPNKNDLKNIIKRCNTLCGSLVSDYKCNSEDQIKYYKYLKDKNLLDNESFNKLLSDPTLYRIKEDLETMNLKQYPELREIESEYLKNSQGEQPEMVRKNNANKKYTIEIENGRHEEKRENGTKSDFYIDGNTIFIYSNSSYKFPNIVEKQEYTIEQLKKIYKGNQKPLSMNQVAALNT